MSAAISEVLNVDSKVDYFNDIKQFEYHSHTPYANSKLGSSDEIRIPLNQQDHYTLPCKSFLIVEGNVLCTKSKDATTAGAKAEVVSVACTLTSNVVGYLFDEIRYELAGVQIAKTRLSGVTSSIKSILLQSAADKNCFHLAGFDRNGYEHTPPSNFSFCVPMKLLLPFFEDFQQIILNVKQELVFLRASNDHNSIYSADASFARIAITKLVWKVPYLQLEDHVRLKFLQILDADRPLRISFRNWEIHEYPILPKSKQHSWTIKTASATDVPRFVILAFQTNRKNSISKTMAKYDLCKLYNVKLFLNSDYLPYDSLLGNEMLMYKMFLEFASSYYNLPINMEYGHEIDFTTFKNDTPIIVLDCSHQSEHLKVSTDIRLDFEFSNEIPDHTTAYCILISDKQFEYQPLTSLVKEVQ